VDSRTTVRDGHDRRLAADQRLHPYRRPGPFASIQDFGVSGWVEEPPCIPAS
jgi:hypothetical protein